MDGFLKRVVRDDERRSGDVLEAFGGRGTVRLLGRSAEGLLLERLEPAIALSTLVGEDDRAATATLAEVIAGLTPTHVPDGTPSAADYLSSFDRYLESGGQELSRVLVGHARDVYVHLCGSQRQVRLLHGDLHHDNVVFDAKRGWVAIDPKGVVGELEFELGAALRNPIALPEVFTDARVIETRVRTLAETLDLDRSRILEWAFSQAVLSTIWLIEDGESISDHPWIELARLLADRV